MLADKTFQHIYSKSDAHRPIEFCLQALCNSVRLDLGWATLVQPASMCFH